MQPSAMKRESDDVSDSLAPRERGTRSLAHWAETALLVAALADLVYVTVHLLQRRLPMYAIYDLRYVALLAILAAGIAAGGVAMRRVRGTVSTSIGGLLRAAFVCCIGSSIAGIVLVQPYRRMEGLLILATASLAFVSWRLLSPWLERTLPRRLRSGFGFALFQICLLALCCEITLRIFAHWKPSPIFSRASGSVSDAVAAARYAPGTNRFGFRCNSGGFYDDEWQPRQKGAADKPRVALIGDSFVVGIVPHYFHFGTVCERETGAEVCNVGLPGIGPFEYADLLQSDVSALAPDLIVVSLFVGNDFLDAAGRFAGSSFGGDWLDTENLLLYQVPRRLWIADAESGELGRAAGEIAGEHAIPAGDSNDPVALARHFPWLDDPALERETMTPGRFLNTEVIRALGACRVDSPPPDAMFAALRAMQQGAGRIPLVCVIIPDEFQVEDDLWNSVEKSAAGFALDRDRPQRLLKEFFDAANIPYLDLLPLLRSAPPPKSPPDGKHHVYSLRDTHLNRRGNEIVGEALANFIRPWLEKR